MEGACRSTLGAASVEGVDFSAAMLAGTAEAQGPRPGLSFRQAEASATGLPSDRADALRRPASRPRCAPQGSAARTGGSILHELSDAQLAELADIVTAEVAAAAGPSDRPIREVDHWTIWAAAA